MTHEVKAVLNAAYRSLLGHVVAKYAEVYGISEESQGTERAAGFAQRAKQRVDYTKKSEVNVPAPEKMVSLAFNSYASEVGYAVYCAGDTETNLVEILAGHVSGIKNHPEFKNTLNEFAQKLDKGVAISADKPLQ